jgi:hypothetical protein
MVVDELLLSWLPKNMAQQGITTILNHMSVVDNSGPLIPVIPNAMAACASEKR